MNWFFEYLWVLEKSEWILRIVDKIAKIWEEKVEKELIETEKISFENVKKILEFVNLKEENFSDKKEFFEKISEYKNFSEKIKNWVEELEKIYEILWKLDIPKNFYKVDFSIARGLWYYTWMVYETTLDDLPWMWSVCSGWRYDDLTKSFSNDDISWVWASIWLDRLLAALDELGLSEEKKSPAKVLIANMDEKFLWEIFKIWEKLRKNWIFTEIYPESVKLQKQFKFADKQKFEFILILWENEIKDWSFTLKNLKNGEQEGVWDFEELVRKLT